MQKKQKEQEKNRFDAAGYYGRIFELASQLFPNLTYPEAKMLTTTMVECNLNPNCKQKRKQVETALLSFCGATQPLSLT